MRMTLLVAVTVIHAACVCCGGKTFDSLDERTQRYIVSCFVDAMPSSTIAIVHSRSDEWLREDKYLDSGVRLVLGLLRVRFSAVIKGEAEIADYDLGYIYVPDSQTTGRSVVMVGRPKSEKDLAPPYRGSLLPSDNLMRLVLLKPQRTILKDRVIDLSRGRVRGREIFEDALRMSEDNFIDKYSIREVFDNRVFRAMDVAVARVDYPAPDMPVTELMKMNMANQKMSEARVFQLQKMSGLIHLSRREVSEVILVAYLMEGANALSEYMDAYKRNDGFLIPFTEITFETNIGKQLFKSISEVTGSDENN